MKNTVSVFWVRLLVPGLLFAGAARLFAPVPQSDAQSAWQQIIAQRRQMQRKSPEQLKREYAERQAAENQAARKAISRPPIDFPHYVHPQNPQARKWVANWLQQNTAEKAGVSTAAPKKRISLISFLVAFVILAGLAIYHYTSPDRETSDTE